MKKLFIKCLFTALTFGMLVSLNTMAAETSSIIIGEDNNISLTSENAEQDGITAIQMSLKVETDKAADVSFNFNQENDIKISEFRYHEDTNTLNIYMADNEPIFNGSDLLDLGAVSATDTDGNSVNAEITAVENSLKFVSQDTLTDKAFSVENTAVTETTTDISDNTSGSVTAETTTTTAIDGESKFFEIEKTFTSSYMITVPDGTENLEEQQNFIVSAENVLIEHGQTLELSVTSKNNWTLKDKNNPTNDTGIIYRMSYGDNLTGIETKTETILTVGDGKKSGNVKLTIISIDKPEMAGTFADTLTFNVDVS